jgi:hypothetical protein
VQCGAAGFVAAGDKFRDQAAIELQVISALVSTGSPLARQVEPTRLASLLAVARLAVPVMRIMSSSQALSMTCAAVLKPNVC